MHIYIKLSNFSEPKGYIYIIVTKKIPYDVNQRGEKVIKTVILSFEHLKFVFKTQKKCLKCSKILYNFFR